MESNQRLSIARAYAATAGLQYYTSLNDITKMNGNIAMPLMRYITSIHNAIPISAVILAQSPYPSNIHPFIGSALAFNPADLLSYVPPTVEVIANDLFVTHGLKREKTIDWINHGWEHLQKGVVLLDARITHHSSEKADEECTRTAEYIKELILLSAFRGQDEITIVALGKVAQDTISSIRSEDIKFMAASSVAPVFVPGQDKNNLQSPSCNLGNEDNIYGIESKEIKVILASSYHPTFFARRHSDLKSPSCTLNNFATSRALFNIIMRSRRQYRGAPKETPQLNDPSMELGKSAIACAQRMREIVRILQLETKPTISKDYLTDLLNNMAEDIAYLGIGALKAELNIAKILAVSGYEKNMKETAAMLKKRKNDDIQKDNFIELFQTMAMALMRLATSSDEEWFSNREHSRATAESIAKISPASYFGTNMKEISEVLKNEIQRFPMECAKDLSGLIDLFDTTGEAALRLGIGTNTSLKNMAVVTDRLLVFEDSDSEEEPEDEDMEQTTSPSISSTPPSLSSESSAYLAPEIENLTISTPPQPSLCTQHTSNTKPISHQSPPPNDKPYIADRPEKKKTTFSHPKY
ncbi:hypothetical protein BZA77DRAFT_341006 [Pyronema omphalodes]|nr:hypothetical protein BZA77DRAFT_341006 [Pyronema omphalodes]